MSTKTVKQGDACEVCGKPVGATVYVGAGKKVACSVECAFAGVWVGGDMTIAWVR